MRRYGLEVIWIGLISVVGVVYGDLIVGKERVVEPSFSNEFSQDNMLILRNEVKKLFYHGWNNYIEYAFPEDELKPISCIGQSTDFEDPSNIGLNDVLGSYSVTLVDSLDMFAIMGEKEEFEKYVEEVRRYVSFNVSTTVQVFETTIRGMGGLLSGHLYATIPRLGSNIEGYDGHLLELAYDLGERLLPAFDTVSGIPYPRINLQKGVIPLEGQSKIITETCTSGAGSMLLEFSLLSRLTGDPRFEKVARRAFFQLWARRSSKDLLGITIDSMNGNWQSLITGIGAGIDSFYEYALKYYILFGDKAFYKIFNNLYDSLKRHSWDGWIFHNINLSTGSFLTSWIDSLGAFFPGLQVLAGDLTSAIKYHLVYYKLWNTYGGIPERWNVNQETDSKEAIVLEWYPLRPEFIESNYYLYTATKDALFLQIGKSIIKDLNKINKVSCGFAGIQDVRIGSLSDRMESFFLSETVKYLYLLFDEKNILNKEYSNFIFSTEAHPLFYDKDVLQYSSIEKFPLLATKIANNLELTKDLYIYDEEYEEKEIKPKVIFERIRNIFKGTSSSSDSSSSSSSGTTTATTGSNEDKTSSLSGSHSYNHRLPPQPQCGVWDTSNSGPFDKSTIASWNGFYSLDSIYNYTKPDWINYLNRPESFEFEESFYNNYITSNPTCRPKVSNQIEILFATPQNATPQPPKIIGYEHNHPNFQHQHIIYSNDLYGKTLRLTRQENFKNQPSTFHATLIDEIDIKNFLIIKNLHISDHDSYLIKIIDNKIQFQGYIIENLIIES